MSKPQSTGEWHAVEAASQHITDPKCIWGTQAFISNDHQWIWSRNTAGGSEQWVPWNGLGQGNPFFPETNVRNQTKRTDSMIHTVVVTTRPVVNNSTNQVVQPEKIVAGPDNTILASDQNIALVLFGVKHAEELEKVEPGLLVVQVRQGI